MLNFWTLTGAIVGFPFVIGAISEMRSRARRKAEEQEREQEKQEWRRQRAIADSPDVFRKGLEAMLAWIDDCPKILLLDAKRHGSAFESESSSSSRAREKSLKVVGRTLEASKLLVENFITFEFTVAREVLGDIQGACLKCKELNKDAGNKPCCKAMEYINLDWRRNHGARKKKQERH